tara:strand:+ start:49 stop:756 length:708 start_codon:yes stop_codon:yes gene_type:complete
VSLKNWDNKTWLSSKDYINTFNNFLIRQIKLDKNSSILDIGCGRGKIIGNLSSKLRLKKMPLGIDIEKHNDRDKRIIFSKLDAIKFLKKNKKKFDLILLKQTIHFFEYKDIKKLIFLCMKSLRNKGKIIIFTLETKRNEIPVFSLMKDRLNKSLRRDQKIIEFLSNSYPRNIKKKFSYKVKVSKKKYIKMIKNRYISTLLNLQRSEIIKGIEEIRKKYKEKIYFNDKLICLILKK